MNAIRMLYGEARIAVKSNVFHENPRFLFRIQGFCGKSEGFIDNPMLFYRESRNYWNPHPSHPTYYVVCGGLALLIQVDGGVRDHSGRGPTCTWSLFCEEGVVVVCAFDVVVVCFEKEIK